MIGFFEHQYLSYKKKHIKNLVALANSDGFMHDNERALVYRLGDKYGLKERQITKIIEANKDIELYVPEKDDEKMNQLFDLLQMVYADGVVDDNEVTFCKDVVNKFGYKELLVDRLIELFKNGDPVPADWENVKLELIKDYS
jgi:uncharacterized tellurite resistance protein B-like protein